jgi:catechol 2,3-dioxygenase-like lactoylglutathione lyase family enzyme
MIDHITLYVSDYAKAKRFFLAALAPLGYEVCREFEGRACGLGVAGKADFWFAQDSPRRKQHIAFRAADRATVDKFHAAALAAGATDEGAPGKREHYHAHYYGAFVLDFDGNNIEACCHTPPA